MNLSFEQPFESSMEARHSPPTRAEFSWFDYVNLAEWFEVRDVSLTPRRVRPGDQLTVTVEYGSHGESLALRERIDSDHPDFCTTGLTGSVPGAALYPTATVGGVETRQSGGCFDYLDTGTIRESIQVTAPQSPGNHQIDVTLRGEVTNDSYSTGQATVVVDEEATEREEDDSGSGDDDGGLDLPGIPNIPGLTDAQTGTAALVFLLVLLLAVAVGS